MKVAQGDTQENSHQRLKSTCTPASITCGRCSMSLNAMSIKGLPVYRHTIIPAKSVADEVAKSETL